MSNNNYEQFFWSVEDKHFWFKGRQNLIKQYLKGDIKRILDVGCASGGNLKSIGLNYDVYGIDLSRDAIKEAKKRGLEKVFVSDAIRLPFKDNQFDMVVCSDLLEHVEQDYLVVAEIYRVLRKDGIAIIGVPAFSSLWTDFDEINHHYRRYDKKRLKEIIHKTNFKIKRLSYWNFFIFIPVFLIRFFKRKGLIKSNKYDIKIPGKFLNSLFAGILKIENFFIAYGFKFPFGISLVAILQK